MTAVSRLIIFFELAVDNIFRRGAFFFRFGMLNEGSGYGL